MKRRNADCGKIRRPIKRNKITEGMYGSTTLLYLKFLILWAIVITADFMFMFRFEFLWPFWLLLRSVHDSFKYKGLAFSVLFVCIAITSDLVCLFFIPVHWLLFAASTYVWVQYVWHTDKGICLPTIILWMLFVYLEAGIRWKDSRHMPHLDLCRPFAAHCIGYPVVTLGFGFKSYVGYRMRQRKQREVAKENEFYMQLLQQALPQEEAVDDNTQSAVTSNNISASTTSNGSITSSIATMVTTATGTALQIAQTTVQATIDSHHQHHNYINHTSATSTSSGNGGIHGDDKTHVQLIPSSSSLSSTVATSTTSTTTTVQMTAMQQQQQQTFNNNHVNLNNSNNSSSSKNAQTTNSSKFNNNCNNISNNNNNSSLMTTTTMIPNGTSGGNIANGHIGNNNSNLNGLTSTTTTTTMSSSSSFYHKGSRRSIDKDKNHDTNQTVNSLTANLNSNRISTHDSRSIAADVCSTKLTNAYLNQISQLSPSMLSSSNHTQKDFKDKDKDSIKNNWDKDNITSSMSSSCSSNSNKENKMYAANSQNDHQHHNHMTTNGGTPNVLSDHKKSHNHHNHHPNGNVLQYDIEENNDTSSPAPTGTTSMTTTTTTTTAAIPSEKTKGRRNRSKKDSSKDKDNHGHHGQNNSNSTSHHQINNHHHNNHNHHHHNNHQQQHHNNNNNKMTDVNSDASSISSSSSSSSSTSTLSTIASHIVAKICESCLRFEAEIKKYRQEINHMKQIENELRQKLESNATAKSCLQAKQRELDELEKRVQDLTNMRQVDMMNLQNAERRLVEERRQRQSLESQLNNEKKARKLAEEKATRPECSEACKQRKQQIESEAKQLRRELKAVEEAKQAAEQQGRKCEQELRMFEAEVRNREAQQGTEVLMSALAAMQDKNSTLEKNLSAETRVKLDLFSALGEAKRQLEIKDSLLRNKDEEVLDLKAKIAQLLAVMPTDTLCLPPCSTTGSSMLRMNDTPPLQGPSSPMGMAALGAVAAAAHQQILTAHQLNRGPVVVSAAAVAAAAAAVVSATTSSSVVTNVSMSMTPSVSAGIVSGSAGNVTNQIGGGGVGNNNNNVVVTQASSNLDPNATAYTPKNSLVGNGSDA